MRTLPILLCLLCCSSCQLVSPPAVRLVERLTCQVGILAADTALDIARLKVAEAQAKITVSQQGPISIKEQVRLRTQFKISMDAQDLLRQAERSIDQLHDLDKQPVPSILPAVDKL